MTSESPIRHLHLTFSDISPTHLAEDRGAGGYDVVSPGGGHHNSRGMAHGGHLHQFRIGEDYYGLPDQELADDFEIIF